MKLVSSTAIPLPMDNIDTDQIIPAAFLKQTDKQGLGANLFFNWRYDEKGEPKSDFILNDPLRAQAQILVAGNNFGCGSSREHAAWALADYGIRAIISTQFADIFKNNALNNGLLPIELTEAEVNSLMQFASYRSEGLIEIDLERQEVRIPKQDFSALFKIDPFKKACLMDGIDETQYLINLRSEIREFEAQLPKNHEEAHYGITR